MRFMKKTAGLLLALLLLLAGCSGSGGAKLVVNGKEVSVPYVMKINGEKISLEEFRYYFLFQTLFDGDGQVTAEENDVYRQLTAERLVNNYAIKQIAKDRGIKLTKEDEQAIRDTIDATIEEMGGREGYLQLLSEYDMTEELYKKMLRESVLYARLAEALFGEGGEFFYTEQEILLFVDPEEYAAARFIYKPLDKEGSTENQKAMQEAEKRLHEGESFEKLLAEYGEDGDMASSGQPKIFLKGSLTQDFEAAVLALNEGETGGLVETDEGYYIVRRVQVNEDLIKAWPEAFRQCEQEKVFKAMLEKAVAKLTVEYHEIFDQITAQTLS